MSLPRLDGATGGRLELVLGSASPGRAEILTRARVGFRVQVSHVDEDAVGAEHPDASPAELAGLLAEAKGRDVAARVAAAGVDVPTLVLGCDSVFEFEGRALGKPLTAAVALERWRTQAGHAGTLHSGHWLGLVEPTAEHRFVAGVVSAGVRFAPADEATLKAYVATGEPLHCAGAFTIDGAGAALVAAVEGDPNAVIGLSVSWLRAACDQLDVAFLTLWGSSNTDA